MEFEQLIGFAGAFCTTVSFLPQVFKVCKEKDLSSLSLGMYCIFTLGVALWLSYGLLLGDPVMIIANSITIVLTFIILVFKIRFECSKKRP